MLRWCCVRVCQRRQRTDETMDASLELLLVEVLARCVSPLLEWKQEWRWWRRCWPTQSMGIVSASVNRTCRRGCAWVSVEGILTVVDLSWRKEAWGRQTAALYTPGCPDTLTPSQSEQLLRAAYLTHDETYCVHRGKTDRDSFGPAEQQQLTCTYQLWRRQEPRTLNNEIKVVTLHRPWSE